MSLCKEDFPTVFEALHGHPPFLWQTRLLGEVLKQGWPDTLAAPTGAGKTAVLDVALFHLALQARAQERQAPRRIVLAVDRRIVVDQAFDRAKKIRDALINARDGHLAAFAAALRALGGTAEPLHVEELRGGMPREDDWARNPAQPTILCTTVDQLGSRLLFRGYGVSPGMAPIHAGLLGEDALLLLDEAHLSVAFRDTLKGVQCRRVTPHGLGLPWAACMLSATPGRDGGRVFALNEEERGEAAIRARLRRAKRTVLRRVEAEAGKPEHVAALVAAARDFAGQCGSGATVAIVVNRVALARAVFDALEPDPRLLLTGRVRPLERDKLIEQHAARLFAAERGAAAAADGPLFVVGTQCVEAGADFDFDALVTQIAPLDALRQRFGRLNRLGKDRPTPGLVVVAKDELSAKANDALYGHRLKTTWDWLERNATLEGKTKVIDMAPDAMRVLTDADRDEADACVAPAPGAPLLRAADVMFLSTTNPAPHPDPCLLLFLHGDARSSPDVSIVWRADLPEHGRLPAGQQNDTAREVLGCLPPRPGEALRVPAWAAQAWLLKQTGVAGQVADAEGEAAPDQEPTKREERWAVRWRGPDSYETEWIEPRYARPGDVLVVPAAYGGCDRYGWAPGSTTNVIDLADDAAAPYANRRLALRLHPALWPADGASGEDWKLIWPDLRAAAETGPVALLDAVIGCARGSEALASVGVRAQTFRSVRAELAYPYGDDADGIPLGVVIVARLGINATAPGGSVSTEDESASGFGPDAIELDDHQRLVAEEAGHIATLIGLAPALRNAMDFAALHHDDGKADPRFQAWLTGADARPGTLLAKSGRNRGAAREMAARQESGLPPHWRHEVLSVRAAVPMLAAGNDAFDAELALYLIGSHHGQGRPFFVHADPWDAHGHAPRGVPLPPGPGPERLDFDYRGNDWPGLFALLKKRYGAWGLAFLEAVVRLADHRVSERSK
jgi:CRISPR-associated endonuclease/helicase Cas3